MWSSLQIASLEERHQGQQSALVVKLQVEKEKHRTHASLVLGEREMHGKETDEWKYVGVCSVFSYACDSKMHLRINVVETSQQRF